MLPISPMADGAISESGSTPSMRHSRPASSVRMRSSTMPSISPTTPSRTPVTSSSGGPIASIASANESAWAAGTEMSTARPSMLESDVLAVPEPMFASSRKASSCISVNWLLIGSDDPFLCGDGGGAQRARGREGVAVDDQGDLAARQDGAAGQRRTLRHGRGERAGNELALADQVADGEHEAALGTVDD